MTLRTYWKLLLICICAFTGMANAFASNVVTINLKDHIFEPGVIVIPENTKIKLVIINHDSSPEEFDSFDLNREKVVFANSEAILFIGPLPKGVYHFFGEFHPDTAIGKVIVADCQTLQDLALEGAASC